MRGNQKPHVHKNLCKVIMKCSPLKNKANRTKKLEDITKYKKQRNLVFKLNRESKPNVLITYRHLITQSLFGISESHIFQINMLGDSKIILIEKENIITNKNEVVQKETLLVNNDEISKTFSNHFSETVEKLNTFKWPFNEKYENIQNEKLTTIIKKFKIIPV